MQLAGACWVGQQQQWSVVFHDHHVCRTCGWQPGPLVPRPPPAAAAPPPCPAAPAPPATRCPAAAATPGPRGCCPGGGGEGHGPAVDTGRQAGRVRGARTALLLLHRRHVCPPNRSSRVSGGWVGAWLTLAKSLGLRGRSCCLGLLGSSRLWSSQDGGSADDDKVDEGPPCLAGEGCCWRWVCRESSDEVDDDQPRPRPGEAPEEEAGGCCC